MTNIHNKYFKYGVLGVSTIVIILLFVIVTNQSGHAQINEDGAYIMNLGENGYEPQVLVLKKGDTVVFTTTRDKHHWPASNLHPSHEIYPEFDSLGPVAPNKTWTFQFNQTGTWNMHDHLRSYFRARIEVTE